MNYNRYGCREDIASNISSYVVQEFICVEKKLLGLDPEKKRTTLNFKKGTFAVTPPGQRQKN